MSDQLPEAMRPAADAAAAPAPEVDGEEAEAPKPSVPHALIEFMSAHWEPPVPQVEGSPDFVFGSPP